MYDFNEIRNKIIPSKSQVTIIYKKDMDVNSFVYSVEDEKTLQLSFDYDCLMVEELKKDMQKDENNSFVALPNYVGVLFIVPLRHLISLEVKNVG